MKAAALMAYSTSDLSTMHGAYFIKCNAVCVLTKASIIHYENEKDDFEYVEYEKKRKNSKNKSITYHTVLQI